MDKLLDILKQIDIEGISIRENVRIDGSGVVDIVDIGDGRLYIERDGNNDDDEALLTKFLLAVIDELPELLELLQAR